MGAAAEVEEPAGLVGGEKRVGFFLDQLALQELAHLLEERLPLFLGIIDALVGQVRLHQLAHLFFQPLEVFFGEGLFAVKIVEETGVRGWADARMRVGEKFEHRRRQKMRGRVSVDFQSFWRRGGDELDGPARGKRRREIDQAAVHLRHQRLVSETRANRLRDFERRGALRKLFYSSVGESDLNIRHSNAMLPWYACKLPN